MRPVLKCHASYVPAGWGRGGFLLSASGYCLMRLFVPSPASPAVPRAQACGPAFGRGFMPGAVKPAGTMSRENPKQPRGMMPRLG